MLRSIISQSKHYLSRRDFVVIALVVLWAAEVFAVQEATLVEYNYYKVDQPALHRIVRLSLNLLGCGLLVLLLPRAVLALVFAADLVFSGVLLAFEGYSGHALSATMVLSTAGEGTSVTAAGFSMLPWWMGILVVGFAVKVFLSYRLGKVPSRRFSLRWPKALRMALVYCAIMGVTNIYKPFTLLLGWESVGGVGSVYGYTPTWAAEFILLDNDEILARALKRSAVASNRLEGLEPPFPVGKRIVLVQVESLDYEATQFKVDGRLVAPNIHALAETSMSYVIRSPKKTGSCDADFTVLMGGMPSLDMPNYKIQGYPFAESFISDFNAMGYRTTAIHNVTGDFFNRRKAYTEIGFDELIFMEEMVDNEGLPDDDWATPDLDMLAWSGDRIRDSEDKQFSILITATSHIPFLFTPADKREFFPSSDDPTSAYLDSIHYVDEGVGALIERLPKGTVVIVYGDHTAGVSSKAMGYEHKKFEGIGLVPFIIHQVGEDISGLQKSNASDLATSGELTLLDMATYMHRVIEQANRAEAVPPPSPVPSLND
jgi:hypothetical protein